MGSANDGRLLGEAVLEASWNCSSKRPFQLGNSGTLAGAGGPISTKPPLTSIRFRLYFVLCTRYLFDSCAFSLFRASGEFGVR